MKIKASGFTIVELLIVIVVIGILAAITMVSYNGIQNRAHDVAIQSDLKQAYQSVQLSAIDTGIYPEWSEDLQGVGVAASGASYDTSIRYNLVYCPPYPFSSASNFAFLAASKSGNILVYSGKGSFVYQGSWTMDDYADICIEVQDGTDIFEGDHDADPELRVTNAGYDSQRDPQWATWVNR